MDNKIIIEKINSLHSKILSDKFAEKVYESEMLALIEAVHILENNEIVKYGKWVQSEKHGYKCSNCNCMSSFWDDNLKSPYCPWCGVKMDLE